MRLRRIRVANLGRQQWQQQWRRRSPHLSGTSPATSSQLCGCKPEATTMAPALPTPISATYFCNLLLKPFCNLRGGAPSLPQTPSIAIQSFFGPCYLSWLVVGPGYWFWLLVLATGLGFRVQGSGFRAYTPCPHTPGGGGLLTASCLLTAY